MNPSGEITTSVTPRSPCVPCTNQLSTKTAYNVVYAVRQAETACGDRGTVMAMSGNTLGCHLYHAGNAVSAPATHCIHAGPSGGGSCGASCEDFCALTTAICPTQYPALASCMTSCAGFNATRPYTALVTSGNNFACRMYHATAASTTPVPHCTHTAVTATAPCTGAP